MPIQGKQQAVEQKAKGGVGLGVDNFVEGGGLQDDFDGSVLDAGFTIWDYNGDQEKQLFLALEIKNEEMEESQEDGKLNPFIQYYSAGKLEHFVPSDDGSEALPVGSKTGLSKSCNAFYLIKSSIEASSAAGTPIQFGTSCKVLVGTRWHFKRQKIERDFSKKGNKDKAKAAGKDGKDEGVRSSDPLLCESYLGTMDGATTAAGPAVSKTAGPGPGPGPKAVTPTQPTTQPAAKANTGPGPKPVPTPAAPTELNADAQAWAQAYILEQLEAAGGSHPKLGLSAKIMAFAKENGLDIKTRNQVVQCLGNEAFLSQEGLGWTFDGTTLTQG